MKLVLFVATIAVLAARADTPKDEPPGISIVASRHQEVPELRRAVQAFETAQTVLGRRRLPHVHIILLYVDRETANAEGVPKTADIFMLRILDMNPPTYYVWIVAGSDDTRLAMASVVVLDRQWGLKLEKLQIDEAVNRVSLQLSGVIDARDLAREGELKTGR